MLNDCLPQNICSLEVETLKFYMCVENTKQRRNQMMAFLCPLETRYIYLRNFDPVIMTAWSFPSRQFYDFTFLPL